MRTEELVSFGLLQLKGAGFGMLYQKQGKFIKVKMMGKQEESQSGQLEQEMGSCFR